MSIDGIRGIFSREAKIGKISIDLLSGIEISDFYLSEYPDSKSGAFFSAKNILFKVKLLPLMRQSIIASEFSVTSPSINLSRKKDGTFNFDSLISSLPHRKHKILPYFLLISDFKITNGEATFINEDTSFKGLILKNLDISAKNISLTSPFESTVSGDIFYKKNKFHLLIRGNVNIKDRTINLHDTNVSMKGSLLHISGRITELAQSPQFDIQVKGNTPVLESFLEIFGKPPDLHLVQKPESNFIVTGNYGSIKVQSIDKLQ